jgi:hypothetical protein
MVPVVKRRCSTSLREGKRSKSGDDAMMRISPKEKTHVGGESWWLIDTTQLLSDGIRTYGL